MLAWRQTNQLQTARHGPTRGRPWSSANARVEFRRVAAQAGIRRRFAPHQLRHAHAVELAREGVPLNVIQRQLGHANLGTVKGTPRRAPSCSTVRFGSCGDQTSSGPK